MMSNNPPDYEVRIAQPFISDEMEEDVIAILRSRKFVQGEFVRKFESAICDYTGARNTIAVNSGTAALHVALESAKRLKEAKKNNQLEVVTTPLSFAATANAIIHAGCKPEFADVDPDTFNLNPTLAKDRINENTLAIEPVDVYGLPADLERFNQIANSKGIFVIEDAAESLGATYNGKKVGSICSISCFSTYATKNLHTGEGGFITTDDTELADYARLIRNQGQASRYNQVTLGYNYRMLEFCAAIGLEQVNKLDDLNSKRADNAKFLYDELDDIKSLSFQKVPNWETHSWYMFAILLKEKEAGIKRDKLVTMLKERGIGADVSWPVPIHLQPFYRQTFGFKEGDFPIAESICSSIFQLPVHPFLTKRQLERIVRIMRELLTSGLAS